MIKKMLIGLVVMSYIHTGFSKGAMYYREHPGDITAALLACPDHQPQGVSCEIMSQIAKDTSVLLHELEQSPQKFGLNIMLIQASIAKQIQAQDVKSQAWAQNQTELHARLALIKLLQSPHR
ncbi:MAG: hypothetical protein CK424_01245 [Legionella sp.]|nr:MAG: hypothetical protein CK424_01245 [Legionella sp.]